MATLIEKGVFNSELAWLSTYLIENGHLLRLPKSTVLWYVHLRFVIMFYFANNYGLQKMGPTETAQSRPVT